MKIAKDIQNLLVFRKKFGTLGEIYEDGFSVHLKNRWKGMTMSRDQITRAIANYFEKQGFYVTDLNNNIELYKIRQVNKQKMSVKEQSLKVTFLPRFNGRPALCIVSIL